MTRSAEVANNQSDFKSSAVRVEIQPVARWSPFRVSVREKDKGQGGREKLR
jgi:hypothetical protein